jgi:transposase
MPKSFDGLSGVVRQLHEQDPLNGALFLFRNRSRDRLKILYWDRAGLAIWYKLGTARSLPPFSATY